jgi:hypothetical protein
MPEYPKRPKLFVINYLKWLIDSGTIAEAGTDVFALLMAVVKREDDLFYKRPPNYFNPQLEREAGFGSSPKLSRTRDRAIKLGLLDYTKGAKRRPGVYFVKGFPNELLEKGGECPNDSLGNPEGKRKESKRKAKGIRHPPIPIPIPDPIPNPSSSSLGTPTPKTSDDDEGLVVGASGGSLWTAEKEAEVIDKVKAADVNCWKEAVRNCKRRGDRPDEVLDALYVAMNYRDAKKPDLVLGAKGFVYWTREGRFPCDAPPPADELRRQLAANTKGRRSSGLNSTHQQRELDREMIRSRVWRSGKENGHSEELIEENIKLALSRLDAKTKDPSQCL